MKAPLLATMLQIKRLPKTICGEVIVQYYAHAFVSIFHSDAIEKPEARHTPRTPFQVVKYPKKDILCVETNPDTSHSKGQDDKRYLW